MDRIKSKAIWLWFDNYWFISGKDCQIVLTPRPSYCDRGNYLAQLFTNLGSDLCREIDEADQWPRYYFDLDRAKLEVEAWLIKRGQLKEK